MTRIVAMRRTVARVAVALALVSVAGGAASAQPPTPPPAVPAPSSATPTTATPTTAVPRSDITGLTQPDATVLAGAMAVIVALIAYLGVTQTRRQTEKHFAQSRRQADEQFAETRRQTDAHFARAHELDRIKALRERYTTCAEQLAHANPAVRQAGVYALAALADDWTTTIDAPPDGGKSTDLHEETVVCLDLLCAYMRASKAEDDEDVRRSIAAVIARHATAWSTYRYDLSGAQLCNAALPRVVLHNARLPGADLHLARLTDADLRDANLADAVLALADLSGADLSGAYLVLANLSGAELGGANLTLANLTGANLSGADLRDANLTFADLRGAKLHGANLDGVDLTTAHFDDATTWPDGFSPSPGRG
ncbi:pentapeptide repeat-containing protein [Nocardia puris]|uniref:pentapeptide repeat-containing protein n=1 Tax=Nocardia puris TaxID=208602 RepID=UPI002B4B3A1B|nr:pentapeptide repeat-containing protein [Nocardia puris]